MAASGKRGKGGGGEGTACSGLFRAAVEAGSEEEREEIIRRLVEAMSLREKVHEMAGSSRPLELIVMAVRYNWRPFRAGGNSRLGIPPIRFTDGPRGIGVGRSTCFPVSMARGAAWDPELEERVGEAMGVEARSLGADFSGGVCINIPRHPGWGRSQETYGDDPFHLGAMGSALVRGLQKHVMACVKHFACNSIEEARFFVDVSVDERTLREIYLPHFRKCVEEGVASVMSAYNRVNGEYCGCNSHLLRDILKGDWGFDGLVMSDFIFGTRDGVRAANAGLDIEMPFPWKYGHRLRRAVRRGRVPEEAVDEAVTRILRQKARFARVGDPGGYGPGRVACREHVRLALEAAQKSIVLLRNVDDALPLDRASLDRIAVVGRLADMPNIGDRGSSRVRPPYTVTALEGIDRACGGTTRVVFEEGRDLRRAAEAAANADVTVVVEGMTRHDEGEAMPFTGVGGDRERLGLDSHAVELIKEVAAASRRCVVVVEAGSAVTMQEWRDDVDAILMAWYPGMEGGNAIAGVLFGEVNPGGKLPIVFPRHEEQLPHFDRKAKTIEYGYYHGYRLFDREGYSPAFPFGFGLSYTEYEYSGLQLSEESITTDGFVTAEFKVSNTGERAGDEIAQLYVGYVDSRFERPIRELKGFARVHLEPGESKMVSIEIPAGGLACYDQEEGRWLVEEIDYSVRVGPSSAERDLSEPAVFRVRGNAE